MAWDDLNVIKAFLTFKEADSITIDPHKVGDNWIYQYHLCQDQKYLFSRDVDITFENTAESAIKYCLENLI